MREMNVSDQNLSLVMEKIRDRQAEILQWLQSYEQAKELPIYSSVDIREAGFKSAVVDTNLFPAGFNNLCEHGLEDSVELLREAVVRRVPGCKSILIIAEEHTRNTWYLENLRILKQIAEKAGFKVKIATFLTVQPAFCENTKSIELETATGNPLTMYCLKRILDDYEAGIEKFCLIIMNNDLSSGIPDILRDAKEPIYPSIQAGWHSRFKSYHFKHTNQLITEFAKIIDVDPWFFSCLYRVVHKADINLEADRLRLRDEAQVLLDNIAAKYKEHNIDEKPYLVLKADAGTYGMGVVPIENADDILSLNRKRRNSLSVGKSSKVIENYLLQEGVPTIHSVDNKISEVCIYQIENNLIGGFYRSNSSKGQRDNLNSKGMTFETMCPHLKKYGDCGIHHDINIFDLYRILARIAAIAAHREIIDLEANQK